MVELTESDLVLSDMQPDEIRGLLEELNMSVSLFHALSDCEAVPEEVFRKTLVRADRKFELMNHLGASLLLVSASVEAHTLDDSDLAAKRLFELAERASTHGIRIGYEAIAAARHVRSYHDAWRIVSAANHSGLGLVVDSFETLAANTGLEGLAKLPADRIFMVQIADAPRLTLDVATLGRHFRCFPGQGSLDVAGFAAKILDSGYKGPFSLEILNDNIRAGAIRQTALDAARSLTFLEERLYAAGRMTSRSRFAEAAPPRLPEQESIGFIEFAVSTESKDSLELWLTRMGFVPAGRHRTKDVQLFRQGRVVVVLNAGTDTFAHYYYHLHGTSVCAIGLRLADPENLLQRADIYSYKRYDERLGPQEYRMPAVRTPDGSLIHLLDESYDPAQDFILEPGDPEPAAGLIGIDHVGRAVPAGQLDTWVLFYRALLGLEPDESMAITDPHGAISSKALHDQSNRLRLPLASTDSNRTVVAHTLSEFGGAGVNQIAFETDDIFATVEKLQANGLPLLRIPANYYRGLEEVHDLSPSLVKKLEELHILFDSDESGGKFLHAYTEFFEGRFFFEFVQRSGGYDGYGAVNSPVRLAAQSKALLHHAHL